MADLRVNVAGVEFQNPLIAASGTFGFGREYNEFYPLSALGGISCKGITIKERPGNPPLDVLPGVVHPFLEPVQPRHFVFDGGHVGFLYLQPRILG